MKKALVATLVLILVALMLSVSGFMYVDLARVQADATLIDPNLVFEHVIVAEDDYAFVRSVCDVDGDGFADIIGAKDVETHPEEAGLTWYRYPNWSKYTLSLFDWVSCDIDSADFDGDGDMDVLGFEGYYDGTVYWFENPRPDGDPTDIWMGHYIGTNYANVMEVEIADFNRDGKLDVVTRTYESVSVFLQSTPTSWSKLFTIDIPYGDGMDVGDLDGDGDVDIVLNGYWLENPYPNMSSDWADHEIDSKWFDQWTDNWQDNNSKVAVADVDGDGRLDVVISHAEKEGYPISWYEASNPRSGPWIEHVIGQLDYCHTLQAGDMDNDGDIDVVAGKFARPEYDPPFLPPPYPIRVYCNSDGEGLSWDFLEVSDIGIYTGVIADIGSDGDLDIAASRSYWLEPIEIWENKISDVQVHPVHLLLTVQPSKTVYMSGETVAFMVNVFNQNNPLLESTLTITITGPSGYCFFDSYPISVSANSFGEHSLDWVVPEAAGKYVVEVDLLPSALTTHDTVWLEAV